MLRKIVTALALTAALGGVAVGVAQASGAPATQTVTAQKCIGVGCGH